MNFFNICFMALLLKAEVKGFSLHDLHQNPSTIALILEANIKEFIIHDFHGQLKTITLLFVANIIKEFIFA